ncbi:MAG TPA: hypothetical protein VJ821_15195 [Anaerolineales bacterium]|nr:hypothetical protein [Anaerolineales bacterium]
MYTHETGAWISSNRRSPGSRAALRFAARACSRGSVDSEHISLETIEVIETPETIHLRFRVVK